MKLLTSLAAVAALFLSACAGVQARENVLVPAMKVAYANVAKDVERGVTNALALEDITPAAAAELRKLSADMTAALDVGTVAAVLAVNWHKLETIATIGIETSGFGPTVKKILRQRLAKFTESYSKLVVR